MKISNTSNRLKELMNIRNLKQVDILNKVQPLCHIYDVKFNKSDLSQYVSGKTEPNQDKLFILSKALNVDVAWLMGFDVPVINGAASSKIERNSYPLSDKEYNHITKYRRLDDISKEVVDVVIDKELERSSNDKKDCIIEEPQTEYNDDTKIIPFCPQLVSAGTGQYVFDDFPTETIAVDSKKFKRATYAIRVRGNSMEPTFYNDDIIIVDREAVPTLNEIGIFIIDNQGYVKRVGNKALISDNKAYAPIKSEDIVCMGKVLGKI